MPTRFTQVQVGDSLNSGIGQLEAYGHTVLCQSALISYTDTTAKNLFVLPANSQILHIIVDVFTAFNSSGTDLLDIGKASSAQEYANDLVVSAAGRILGSSASAKLPNWDDIGTSQVTIQGLYKQSVSDASAGSARISIEYIAGNNLE